MANIYDYIDAGWRVFGLFGATADGRCECGNPECSALYKHPRISAWQSVPQWSDEQIETFASLGHFATGFGALCAGALVVDIDARNGGVASFELLCNDVPDMREAGFVVNTGSGGGSQHRYYSLPQGMAALSQNLPRYPGIDFKSSGFVVGAGSRHASGAHYETDSGNPADITPAPQALLDMLTKPQRQRVMLDGHAIDVDAKQIAALLDYVDPSCGYEMWIKCGMAIHHCLGAGGFDLWDTWSCNGASYPGSDVLARHWHSFGKAANPAGYGTLLHYARAGGYAEDVTFEYTGEPLDDDHNDPLDVTDIDLARPPGFVGELTAWINSQCLYPRESLAVAAALCAVSALCGMRFVDTKDGITPNLIAMCVAGSGTGKEAIAQAYLTIMRTAGIQGALHGGFKSEQELFRNLIRHQAAFYAVDEMGIVLRKLLNANRSGASYLEGIIGQVMSIYSKADGFLPITGDLKEEIRDSLLKELAKAEKAADNLPADSAADSKRARIERESARLKRALDKIDDGLDSPYLTILGYTTPITFDSLMGHEQATNGFLARAVIFNDLETNPKRKSGFSKAPMTEQLEATIRNLWAPGHFDATARAQRVEFEGDKTPCPSTAEAVELLDRVYEKFHAAAEEQKGATGLEAIPRRGYEIAAKVSMILALPSGVRTAEHVRYGYALAMRDVQQKIRLAYSTEQGDATNGLAARVLSLVTREHGETEGVIRNRLRNASKEQVRALLDQMVDKGLLVRVTSNHPQNKREIVKFFSGLE